MVRTLSCKMEAEHFSLTFNGTPFCLRLLFGGSSLSIVMPNIALAVGKIEIA